MLLHENTSAKRFYWSASCAKMKTRLLTSFSLKSHIQSNYNFSDTDFDKNNITYICKYTRMIHVSVIDSLDAHIRHTCDRVFVFS